MGFDTRYWGPSAWQLFHHIAFFSPHPDDFLLSIKNILPCKYCRESTTQFMNEHPLRKEPAKWFYEIHNMVNDKLRTQAKTDPTIIKPPADPTFEEVKEQYKNMKPTSVPGRDFLFSLAANYPDSPEPPQMCQQRAFLHSLAEVYPFEELRETFQLYLRDNEPTLVNRRSYMKWMYRLLSVLSKKTGVKIPNYKGYAHHVMYYKSGCSKKSYHGKTCRKLQGGGRTKDRDHAKTYRVSHINLL